MQIDVVIFNGFGFNFILADRTGLCHDSVDHMNLSPLYFGKLAAMANRRIIIPQVPFLLLPVLLPIAWIEEEKCVKSNDPSDVRQS